MPSSRYKGDIVAGSLLVKESRMVADILIQGYTGGGLYEKILKDNILQKRSLVTAKRQARLIWDRLLPFDQDFRLMVRDGTHEQATQALLCAAIKHSRLLGDFIRQVIHTQITIYKTSVSTRDWDQFFEQCELTQPSLAAWSASTRNKVRQIVFRMLAEAKIIDSTRSKNLLPFSVMPDVRTLLHDRNEDYVLHCLEIFL